MRVYSIHANLHYNFFKRGGGGLDGMYVIIFITNIDVLCAINDEGIVCNMVHAISFDTTYGDTNLYKWIL